MWADCDALYMNLGRAVQVDPLKYKLKAPGAKRLKLTCDIVLSTSAFKFNLRRYIVDDAFPIAEELGDILELLAGAYTRSHFRST